MDTTLVPTLSAECNDSMIQNKETSKLKDQQYISFICMTHNSSILAVGPKYVSFSAGKPPTHLHTTSLSDVDPIHIFYPNLIENVSKHQVFPIYDGIEALKTHFKN